MAKNVIAKGKPSQDDLASILSLHINKQLAKIGSSLYSFDDSVENPSDIKYWVSTGSTLLDLAIANRPNAGLPFGRIVEINSLEGAGKSLLCAHIVANTQKMGGIGIYIDTENAADRTFLNAVGVDTKAMLYTQLDTVEDIFDTIEQMILKVRESDKDKPLVIIVDSVSAATTKVESEADYSKDGWSTTKAIILSKAMRKMTLLIAKQKILLVLTSQLRQKLGAPIFAEQWCVDPYTTIVRIKQLRNDDAHNDDIYTVEESISLVEFSKRFLSNEDFTTPEQYDISDLRIEIESFDSITNKKCFKPVVSYIVKPTVDHYYTDGKLYATWNHSIVENGKEIYVQDHPDFKRVDKPLNVVDIEVADTHVYYANGRLNHNTTSGGKAIPFHSSVRIRLKSVGQIKGTYNNFEQIVGVKTNAKVIKNRIGPPFRHVNFDIHFDSGVQDYISWFDFMIDIGMITKASGKKYQMVVLETNEPEGEEFTKNKFIEHILTDNEFRTLIYDKICSAYIMKYKPIDQVDYDGLEIDELEENLI